MMVMVVMVRDWKCRTAKVDVDMTAGHGVEAEA